MKINNQNPNNDKTVEIPQTMAVKVEAWQDAKGEIHLIESEARRRSKILYSSRLREQFEKSIKIPVECFTPPEGGHLGKRESLIRLIDANWTVIETYMKQLREVENA